MQLFASCITCLLDSQERSLQSDKDEARKLAYFKKLLQLIDSLPADCDAPTLAYRMNGLRQQEYGPGKGYAGIKTAINRLMLGHEQALRQRILQAADPLREALRFARTANYIDFSSVETVKEEELFGLFDRSEDELDETEYRNLLGELQTAGNLLYILDNCGEIILDKLALEQLQARFPALHITLMVRGAEASNDATMEDAQQVGLAGAFPCVTTGRGIQGVTLALLPEDAALAVRRADVILAKGQGNFESLHGCRLNIYYLFLCKCGLFTRRFGVPRFTGMLINEKRVQF